MTKQIAVLSIGKITNNYGLITVILRLSQAAFVKNSSLCFVDLVGLEPTTYRL